MVNQLWKITCQTCNGRGFLWVPFVPPGDPVNSESHHNKVLCPTCAEPERQRRMKEDVPISNQTREADPPA